MAHSQAFFGMAMKVQAQSRATISALGDAASLSAFTASMALAIVMFPAWTSQNASSDSVASFCATALVVLSRPNSARVGASFDEGSFLLPSSNRAFALGVALSISPNLRRASTLIDKARSLTSVPSCW